MWGHEYARGKVGDARFHPVTAGDAFPGGRALDFDQPAHGSGTPLYLPSHRALAVGDVLISVEGVLRPWWEPSKVAGEWFRERLLPSLRAWTALPIERILVAHGRQVAGGADELRAALERPPHEIE